MSWSCGPFSITKPLDMTAIMSEFWMVDRRWAITMQVRPSLALSSASCTVCSGKKHTHEVAYMDTHTQAGAIISSATQTQKLYNYSNFTIMCWLLSLECSRGSVLCRGLSAPQHGSAIWAVKAPTYAVFFLKRLYWRVGMSCELLVIIIDMMNDNDVNDNNN